MTAISPGPTVRLIADAALIGGAVQRDVQLDIAPDRTFAAVVPNQAATPSDERVTGLVVPGMSNLHSHAFQRAMAGLAERGGRAGDNFWRWRDVMYRFLALLTPEDIQAIAEQAYVECLLHGYTAIAEFHYLHNAPDGTPYDNPAELSLRIAAAAEGAGIGLTLLPVLYRHSQFGGAPPRPGQARFVLGLDAYADLCADMAGTARVGVAPHSLRAVTPEELTAAIEIAGQLDDSTPIHIHVAEQEKEVADCLAWSGARPVDFLLDHAQVGPHWCLVHATHMTEDEVARLAHSRAVAGLCPTTEANLGDGIFPLRSFLDQGGRFGIGSDSNVGTSPVEELRWLDYTNRLITCSRNVLGLPENASIATNWLTRAVDGGGQALGYATHGIAVGARADLVVLDTNHPGLVGHGDEGVLDAWLFSGNRNPIRHVMSSGRWVVRDGVHARQHLVEMSFKRSIQRIFHDI